MFPIHRIASNSVIETFFININLSGLVMQNYENKIKNGSIWMR